MKTPAFIAALAAAALVLPAAAALSQRTTAEQRGGERRSNGPEGRNWMETAVRTPEGGFRVGNPNARVKLVEYLSLTCPHCAEFAHQGGERLFQDYVRSGRVSVEYRNYVLNGYDLAAAFITRCASPREYFSMSHELLGTQPRWMGRMQTLTDAQRAELRGLAPLQAMQRIVAMLGLDAVAARHGVSPAEQRTCLADQAGLDRIGAMKQAADAAGVHGTPTFFINGQMVQVNTWAGIEPLLRGR
ncbi:MAG TPA: thioredoxin domain-containing protein [Allosphingosinicella sp.]|nr:thioredoxin domain-containing protein [Allosphingosinicella sp.]